jgi:hypothetical protein
LSASEIGSSDATRRKNDRENVRIVDLEIYNGRQNEFDTERSTALRLRMTVIEMPLPMYDGFVEKCDSSSREYALLKNSVIVRRKRMITASEFYKSPGLR